MEFLILEIITGDEAYLFNYFFTLLSAFGFFTFLVVCLVKIISRS